MLACLVWEVIVPILTCCALGEDIGDPLSGGGGQRELESLEGRMSGMMMLNILAAEIITECLKISVAVKCKRFW